MTLTEVFAGARDHILLDFDGPVCAVFGTLTSRTAADRLKPLLGGALSPDAARSEDPFDLLHFASTIGPGAAAAVERQFRRLELEAVATARETPGATTAVRALAAAGYSVTIVSNNAAEAVRAYLSLHDLTTSVRFISARTEPDPALLKPNPHLLLQAIHCLGTKAGRCVMVGDSVSDIEAAHAAGTSVVAYANKSGKRERFEQHEPDFIIDRMEALLDACMAA